MAVRDVNLAPDHLVTLTGRSRDRGGRAWRALMAWFLRRGFVLGVAAFDSPDARVYRPPWRRGVERIGATIGGGSMGGTGGNRGGYIVQSIEALLEALNEQDFSFVMLYKASSAAFRTALFCP